MRDTTLIVNKLQQQVPQIASEAQVHTFTDHCNALKTGAQAMMCA